MKQLGFSFERATAPAAEPAPPPSRGELIIGEALRLEQNVALLAGAGTGKTWSLVTMCLHLLAGARQQGAVECNQLALLTFTEKAADEMKSRLRARLDGLVEGAGEKDERLLRDSFAALGQPFPSSAKWRALRDELGAVTIGTFHSLCVQLLKREPSTAALELLDEREASRLLRDAAERAVLARIEQGGPFRELTAEVGFDRLLAGLVPVAARLREEGIVPSTVAVGDAKLLRARFDEALDALRTLARGVQPKPGSKQVEQLRAFMQVLPRVTFDNFEALLGELRAAVHGARAPLDVLRKAVAANEADPLNLSQLYAACLLAPHEAQVREVLSDVVNTYEAALRARGVLDFTGLLVATRDLLRDNLPARVAAAQRFGALLVDEFQDTNRLQLEIILLLAEDRRVSVSKVLSGRHEEIVALPLRPGFLAVVGDRKQSIYEFRGADVSVFEVMAKAIVRCGGARAYLKESRRSTAGLLKHFNTGFAALMGPGAYDGEPADFEVVYEPEHDDLVLPLPAQRGEGRGEGRRDDAAPLLASPRFAGGGNAPIIELADSTLPEKYDAQIFREHDAEVVARAVVRALDEWKLKGGEVAVLFARFTQVEQYRQALVRHGVRHRVVRGRGFYGAQEVVDLAAFLTLLTQPDDRLARAIVLRSGFVGLTDSSWVSLSLDGELESLSPHERDRLRHFEAQLVTLRAAAKTLGLRALLRATIDAFALRVTLAASPFGEQALANLDKLLMLAAGKERAGMSVAAFAEELLALADEAPREAEGEVVDELDLHAVTLCTVHQAKGLEWPVVVLPDLMTAPRSEAGAVRFDRQFGLALVKPSRGDEELKSHSAVKLTAQLNRRARAEHLRLLYVALTRARDHVILGLRQPRAKTWANDVEALFELRVTDRTRHTWQVTELPAGRPPETAAAPQQEVSSLIERVRTPPSFASRELLLSVSQLHDFIESPAQFHRVHHLGLPSLQRGEGGLGRAHGLAAHRLLQLTPLHLVGTSKLKAALEELRHAERLDAFDVVPYVEAFWNSTFGREAAAAEAKVFRELPFALRLHGRPDLVLRGQIDLLIEREHELVLVDYKTTTREPLERYQFQLACYALAARRFVNDARPIRTGISFLLEDSLEPQFTNAQVEETQLVAAAARFAQALATQTWLSPEEAS